eukprot:9115976-Pyramimonas_sp.AAC.1
MEKSDDRQYTNTGRPTQLRSREHPQLTRRQSGDHRRQPRPLRDHLAARCQTLRLPHIPPARAQVV